MKKNYIKPSIVTVEFKPQSLMNIVSGNGIPYGGTDNGNNKPGSRYVNKLWEDEEDEDDWW